MAARPFGTRRQVDVSPALLRGDFWQEGCRCHARGGKLRICYVQLDGEHIQHERCACAASGAESCPIDFHKFLWAQKHPMWKDESNATIKLVVTKMRVLWRAPLGPDAECDPVCLAPEIEAEEA